MIFRLTRPTAALVAIDGASVVITVPATTVVTLLSGPLEDDTIVDVLWDDRRVQMFARDLSGQAELLSSSGSQ